MSDTNTTNTNTNTNETTNIPKASETSEISKKTVNNLVIEGGGVKGIAFVGAIKALEEKNILAGIHNFIGSSAGSIIAALLSVKMNHTEIHHAINNLDFTKIKDGHTFAILYNFIRNFGIYLGDYFINYCASVLEKHTGNGNITFQQIYDRYGNVLVITGTNLTKGIVEYFSYKNYPDMEVKMAMRISMSIPYFFEAVKFNNCIWVDGGVLDNYPFNYFSDTENTIGLKLVGSNEKKDDTIYHYRADIDNIKDFSICLIDAMTNQIDRLHIKSNYWKNTITINTLGVNTTDFALSDKMKKNLVEEGYKSVNSHIFQ